MRVVGGTPCFARRYPRRPEGQRFSRRNMMNSIRAWAARLILAASVTTPSLAADTFDLVSESETTAWNPGQPKGSKDFSTRDRRDDNSAPTCHSTPDNDADNPQIRIVAPPLA